MFKKVYSLVSILIVLLVFAFSSNKVNASESDNGKASFEVTQTTGSFTTDYTMYKTDLATTVTSGISYNQRVHVFTQKQTSNSKIVTWAVKNNAGKLAYMTVPGIAADYEKTHPGWKVLGGINADQYVMGFGTNIPSTGKDYYYPQPYYPMICDNEGWFIMTGIPVSGAQNIVGLLQDGSNDPLISGQANIKHGNLQITGVYLYILDSDGNKTNKFEINKVNETPREIETTLWTSHYNDKEEFPEITIGGNLYVVENAERAYASNSIDYTYKGSNGVDAFFGKGLITSVSNKATIGYGDFAIETNDKILQEKLNVGTKIIVQYEIGGGIMNVESAIGFHTIHRMDNKDLTTSSSYNTSKYPRSLIGRTSDGKIVLMAIDQRDYSGANFDETNAALKNYGVVEAYQMDGGGSVTAVINDNGEFKVVNCPRDGSPRRVFSALLAVEKIDDSQALTKSNEIKIYKKIYNKEYFINKEKKEIFFQEKYHK